MRLPIRSSVLLAVVLAGSVSASAGTIIPAGLIPGDRFQLAFVTRGVHDAVSPNIADYNAFVQAQAELNPSLTGTDDGVAWRAIASTSSVDARDNALVGANVPVYLLDGTLIASGFQDMWDGALHAYIGVDQYGAMRAENLDEWKFGVWTGSQRDGTVWPDANLRLGGAAPIFGWFADNLPGSFRWIENGANPPASKSYPLYALSSEIVVPTVPEASSTGPLLLAGLAALGMIRARFQNATPKPGR